MQKISLFLCKHIVLFIRNCISLILNLIVTKKVAIIFVRLLILLIISLYAFPAQAQSINYGLWGGLSFRFGTTQNRVGVAAGGFCYYDFVQINLRVSGLYNIKTYGPPKKGFELQLGGGLVVAYGKRDSVENPFLSRLDNKTGRKHSVSVGYDWYFDKIGTSQRSGLIGLQFGDFAIATENDLLGQAGQDKYRTAAILLSYRVDSVRIAVSSVLWTGNTSSDEVIVVQDSAYPARFGYKDLTDAQYGGFSNGAVSAQIEYAAPYFQTFVANVGVDSEHVRNLLQNKIMHDMYFIPPSLIPDRNPHVPMVDTENKPYLYNANQKIKSSKLILDLGVNMDIFY